MGVAEVLSWRKANHRSGFHREIAASATHKARQSAREHRGRLGQGILRVLWDQTDLRPGALSRWERERHVAVRDHQRIGRKYPSARGPRWTWSNLFPRSLRRGLVAGVWNACQGTTARDGLR